MTSFGVRRPGSEFILCHLIVVSQILKVSVPLTHKTRKTLPYRLLRRSNDIIYTYNDTIKLGLCLIYGYRFYYAVNKINF